MLLQSIFFSFTCRTFTISCTGSPRHDHFLMLERMLPVSECFPCHMWSFRLLTLEPSLLDRDTGQAAEQVVNTPVVFLCSDCMPFARGLSIVPCKYAFSRAEVVSSSKARELGFASRRRLDTGTLSLLLSRLANCSESNLHGYRRHTMAASGYCNAALVSPISGSGVCHFPTLTASSSPIFVRHARIAWIWSTPLGRK